MQGFLDDFDMDIIRGDERIKPKRIVQKVISCEQCGLESHCKTPHFEVYGNGKKQIMLVLDTPSESDDTKGKPWAGDIGGDLRRLIEGKIGIDLYEDCYTVYAVSCKCDKVTAVQVNACRKYLHNTINELNPKVIIPFGYWATIGISGDILTNKATGKNSTEWHNEYIPDQRFLKWICPTFERQMFDIYQKDGKTLQDILIQHIKKAMTLIDIPVKKRDDESNVIVIKDVKKAIKVLDDLYNTDSAVRAFDYETTGRKPYRTGHKIYSVAISDGKVAYAMPFFDDDDFKTLFIKCLRAKHIYWIAHNAKFEWLWSKVILKTFPKNLAADTMLLAHAEHSQKRVGLKALTYLKFGVAGYEDDIQGYLESDKNDEKINGANAFNRIEQADLDKILLYNGLDPLYTYQLWEYYQNNLSAKLKSACKFFDDVSIAFSQAESNGMVLYEDEVKKQQKLLNERLSQLEKDIQKEAIEVGWDKPVAFSPSKVADIKYLVYDKLGNKPESYTDKGNIKTDKGALEKIDLPIIKNVLDWKKFEKLNGTYISGILKENVNGYVNPYFNLHTVSTYRTSSDSPNFQNFPKRDKEVFNIIRNLLFPHKGHKLGEYDYRAIEVLCNACINKDPNLIKYVTDPNTDMHKDTGEELFCYEKGQLPKYDRQVAKGAFVFAQFYGDWYESCAKGLWEQCSPETKEHLKNKGFRNLKQYTDHVQYIESLFWEKRFPVYAQWKKEFYNFYLKHGYVDSPTGFRYFAPMDKKQLCNAPAQGGACHVLIWTFTEVNKIITKERLKSKLIGQIHDSALPSIEPSEEAYIDKLFYEYGTIKVRERFDWLIVPLQIEKAIGNVDEPWSKIKEIGILGRDIPII